MGVAPRTRTVLLIATTTGYQIRSFGDAAAQLGVELLFASDRCDHLDDPWRDRAIPVRFQEPEASTRMLVETLATSPDAVIAVGDRPTLLAAYVKAAFGQPGNSPEAALRSRNKLAAREAFARAGLHVPRFACVPVDADPFAVAAGWVFPVVLKPLALSGSRGVIRADTPGEFDAAFARVRRLLQAPDIRLERDEVHDRVLVESFIPGREYAVEGVLTDGAFTPFTIFDKPDPLDGPFFEETIYLTPSQAPAAVQSLIVSTIAAAALALGLTHGPVHAECRVNESGVWVLEVAARPIGGLCSRALRFTEGRRSVSLEEVLLRQALGESVGAFSREDTASGVMMIPIPSRGVLKGVAGVDDARQVTGVDDIVITAKVDAVLTPLPEGRSYLGFIFARDRSPSRVEQALREAHARLRFTIDRELRVLSPDGLPRRDVVLRTADCG
jgi:biotin carboxylase